MIKNIPEMSVEQLLEILRKHENNPNLELCDQDIAPIWRRELQGVVDYRLRTSSEGRKIDVLYEIIGISTNLELQLRAIVETMQADGRVNK